MNSEKNVVKNKKLYAVIVGYGNRGQVYADYSLQCPEEFGVGAVVDPNEFKLSEAKKRYALNDNQLFKSFEDFVKSGLKVDFAINATMDQDHYETAMQILGAKYDMLIEKPIVESKQKLLDIKNLADKNGCKVFVCHVLRYTPFYTAIKKILNDGVIGEIMTMEMNEHVVLSHYLTSYVRGKWNSEEKCGSSFLLAKCCHDFDIMCWLNNATEPESISSFGSRSQFVKSNRPEGASEYCYNCKYERECHYSAIRQYIEMNVMPFLVWDRLNKPLDEITLEEKQEFLKKDVYGKCAYNIEEADIVDRQNATVYFKNGSCAVFTMVGGASKADRYIHIVGSKGEIEGKLEENKFKIRKYTLGQITGSEEEIDVSKDIIIKAQYGGHSGGDFAIMKDLIAYLNGDKSSISITSIEDSVNGHLCIYAAEESRKNNVKAEIKY